MNGLIGYYVHHQGEGHRQRAAAIAAAYRGPMVLIGTGLAGMPGNIPSLDLPDDRLPHGTFDGADGTTRPPSLHYAPLHHSGLRQRVAMIADWIAASRPDFMIIDVSVEVAMLARLASVPIIYVRLNGRRDDQPHRDAYTSAAAFLAPFPEQFDDPSTLDWVKAKTCYAPGIVTAKASPAVDPDRVLVVVGKGGAAADGDMWAAAAAAVPGRHWRVIGPATLPARTPDNLEICGWVDNAEEEIASAGVVIGAAGDGLVSAVLANRRPFICRPEPRAFDEQVCKAEKLAALDAAIVISQWPQPAHWRSLLEAAEPQAKRRLPALHSCDGAAHAARWLERMVASPQPVLEAVS
jgi:predicted glycosyltransferase